ncbi:MAG: hypothetical protein RL291_1658, partial [Pseudomonadota bacterium]
MPLSRNSGKRIARTYLAGMLALTMIVAAVFAYATHLTTTKSVTIPLVNSGLSLKYTLTWGWGMSQMICLSSGSCSDSSEVWKRPRNARAEVYAAPDGRSYF